MYVFKNKTVEEVVSLLKPGTLIRCKGTRDGNGLREVVEVKSRKAISFPDRIEYISYEVICWQVKMVNYRTNELGIKEISVVEKNAQVTTHGLDKVIGLVNIDNRGKLIISDRF